MNYKGNAFSAGRGRITDARQSEGKIHFLQSYGGAYNHRVFDPTLRSFAVEAENVSFGGDCFFENVIDRIIGLYGTLFVSEEA